MEIFKHIYSKTKYAAFDPELWEDTKDKWDYSILIKWLRQRVKKLSNNIKKEYICLQDPTYWDDLSEFNDIEKIGRDPTFDPRIGNKYTRKTFVKDVYNQYYYNSHTPKNLEKVVGNGRKMSIRSQGQNKADLIRLSGKNIGNKDYDNSEDTKNSTIITGACIKREGKEAQERAIQVNFHHFLSYYFTLGQSREISPSEKDVQTTWPDYWRGLNGSW